MRELTQEEWDEVRAAWALPGARWMPGMLAVDYIHGPPGACVECGGPTVQGVCRSADCQDFGYASDGATQDHRSLIGEAADDAWPDVRDPATAGCLEHLLGAAEVRWEEPDLTLIVVHWDGLDGYGEIETTGARKGLALCRAALVRGRWGDA